MRIINDDRTSIGDYVEVYRVGDRVLGRLAGDTGVGFRALGTYDSEAIAQASLQDFIEAMKENGGYPDYVYTFTKIKKL